MKIEKIKIIVGFDQKEAIAYHVFCQSILERSTIPVEFIPLAENTLSGYRERHTDGSNTFVYSRFLTPYLNNYEGWSIFADGDMVCCEDISKLIALTDDQKAVMVVKHDYKTKMAIKYLGNRNENYPRKNWSSLILWNCSHEKNEILTPEFIEKQTGSYLHRFSWLSDDEIGEIPIEWNWLAIEYEDNYEAKLVHYTLGTPCFKEFSKSGMSDLWFIELKRMMEGMEGAAN